MFSNMFRHLQPLTLTNLLSKKPPFDKIRSSNEKADVSFTEKQAPKIIGIFDKKHQLTPLKKCKFFGYSEVSLLSSKKTHFEKTTSSDNKAQVSFTEKKARKKFGIFNQNHLLIPLEKCKFFYYSKMTFMSSKSLLLGKQYHQTTKKRFLIQKSRLERNLEFLTRIMGYWPLWKNAIFFTIIVK